MNPETAAAMMQEFRINWYPEVLNWQPLDDRVIVRRIEKPVPLIGKLVLTDAEAGNKPRLAEGIVLACGPGKWVEGTWWYTRQHFEDFAEFDTDVFGWQWIPGYRKQLDVRPGDKVLFNARWNDFAHDELKGTGADGTGPLERPLSYRFDPAIHLIQEADVAGKLG